MSLVPMLFSNWWEDLDHPHHVFDQDFGVGLSHDQLLTPQLLQAYMSPAERRLLARPFVNYARPWAELLRNAESATSTVKPDKDKFQVILDVQQFKPEEIDVKVKDKFVTVEAKHEEKQDEHGWISRQFQRKYLIPEQCDLAKVNSSLSSDGVLTITVPRKPEKAIENERSIKIEHTGKPAIREDDKKAIKQQKEQTNGPKK
ncbi:protein lethal(2)essential for life-like [Aphidius gifuensis]|uniref:Small heat shock protein n=1 Tax=Aphidius gifuensis TaxID=684658 RepID=A0A2U9K4A7_APHGI|nr:protein lethal(2)essential for life-like [Aphidius gifuensis]AWS20700.1 small heat shock protein [Aphidius gifuensis]